MNQSLWRVLCASIAMAAMLFPAVATGAPTSIFDDNWVPPPKRAEPPPPVLPERLQPHTPATRPATIPVAPPPAVVTPPTPPPNDPFTTPPPEEPPKPVVVARKPVPDKTAQNASRKLMREVYAKQLADKS